MTNEKDLLATGGVSVDDVERVIAGDERYLAPRFQPLASPSATDELGRRLASELSAFRPDRLLIARESHDEILAFVVARELGCDVVVVWSSEGILGHDGELQEADRVAILSESFRSVESLHGPASYASYRGATIVAAAALIDSPVLEQEAAHLGTQAVVLACGT